MALAAALPGNAVAGPHLKTETLRLGLLWLMACASAFVFIEPSPYEIAGVIAILLFAVSGLSLRPALTPLIVLLILLNIGYGLSVTQVADQLKPVIWVLVSLFLGATAVFYGAMLGANTQRRLEWLMRGYLAGALIASFIAIGAYFHAFGGASDLFMLYSRARGSFNDPNVLGAFLVLPGLLVFQRVLAGRRVIGSGIMLMVILAALFLSFSRAAWGVFLFSALVLMATMFLTSRSPGERVRIVMVAILGLLIMALFVAALLSIEKVADMFTQRASLDQSYDVGRYGRFGRYALGADLALDRPLGIGPMQFSRYFPEDPHNSYLNAFMSGGWLGGVTYLALILLTALHGLRFVTVRTPWQATYQAVYAAFLGLALESAIIDTDHWRHYFLVIGVLWGLIAATRGYVREASSPASRFAVPEPAT